MSAAVDTFNLAVFWGATVFGSLILVTVPLDTARWIGLMVGLAVIAAELLTVGEVEA